MVTDRGLRRWIFVVLENGNPLLRGLKVAEIVKMATDVQRRGTWPLKGKKLTEQCTATVDCCKHGCIQRRRYFAPEVSNINYK